MDGQGHNHPPKDYPYATQEALNEARYTGVPLEKTDKEVVKPNDYEIRVELYLDGTTTVADIRFVDGQASEFRIGHGQWVPAGILRLVQNALMSGQGQSMAMARKQLITAGQIGVNVAAPGQFQQGPIVRGPAGLY